MKWRTRVTVGALLPLAGGCVDVYQTKELNRATSGHIDHYPERIWAADLTLPLNPLIPNISGNEAGIPPPPAQPAAGEDVEIVNSDTPNSMSAHTRALITEGIPTNIEPAPSP